MSSQIHCVLTEWKSGKKRDVKFSSTVFSLIYDVHLATLVNLQKESPGNYRETMTKIYKHTLCVIVYVLLIDRAYVCLKGRDCFPAAGGEGPCVVS